MRSNSLILILALIASIYSVPPSMAQKTKKSDEPVKEKKEKKAKESEPAVKQDKPHPLVPQIEAALASGLLIEPAGSCAWDLYQILKSSVPSEPALKQLGEKLYSQLGIAGSEAVNLYLQGANHNFTREEWTTARQIIDRAQQIHSDNKELKVVGFFYDGMIALSDKQPDKATTFFHQGLKQD